MADLIRKTGAFLRDVREIVRKENDERAKCPRCRGSGLLYLQSPWLRSSPPSNAPCLFCEGLGVMSIVGLRGYMIGRTDAMLNTKEAIKNRSKTVPENTQVHANSCKLSTRRHVKVSPNSVSNPIWLQEARREVSLIEEAVDHSTEFRESIDEISPLGLVGLDQAGWRYRHKFYARTSDSFSSIPAAFDSSKNPDSSVDLKKGFNDADSSKGSSSKHVRSSPRGPRSSRRPRNRIREKAEREAEARARKVHKPVQSSFSAAAPSWNPLLRMCRFLMPLSTPDPPKQRLVIDAA